VCLNTKICAVLSDISGNLVKIGHVKNNCFGHSQWYVGETDIFFDFFSRVCVLFSTYEKKSDFCWTGIDLYRIHLCSFILGSYSETVGPPPYLPTTTPRKNTSFT